MCLVFNPQSRGTVTLRSSDPSTKPVVDPRFLTHPFDRRVIIDGVRETMRMLSAPVYAAHTVQKLGPKDDSDEAIWVSFMRSIEYGYALTSFDGTDGLETRPRQLAQFVARVRHGNDGDGAHHRVRRF
jgi:choline dehydrogenase-like flavoprotein